jgi:hypothetical protein
VTILAVREIEEFSRMSFGTEETQEQIKAAMTMAEQVIARGLQARSIKRHTVKESWRQLNRFRRQLVLTDGPITRVPLVVDYHPLAVPVTGAVWNVKVDGVEDKSIYLDDCPWALVREGGFETGLHVTCELEAGWTEADVDDNGEVATPSDIPEQIREALILVTISAFNRPDSLVTTSGPEGGVGFRQTYYLTREVTDLLVDWRRPEGL